MTPWAVAYQAPTSIEFSRQEYWSGLPFPSPRDLPNPGIEPRFPALQTDTLTSKPPGKPKDNGDLLQKIPCMHCYTQCPQPCRRPLPTHASAGDSWTLTGKSVSVSHGVHCSFFLEPGMQCSAYAPQESIPQSCVSSDSSMVGLIVNSSKRAYAIP